MTRNGNGVTLQILTYNNLDLRTVCMVVMHYHVAVTIHTETTLFTIIIDTAAGTVFMVNNTLPGRGIKHPLKRWQ